MVQCGVLPEKQHACEICYSKFWKKSNKERHVRAVHEKLKLFPCDRCDKSFSEKGHFKEHVETVHEGIKRFKVLSNIAQANIEFTFSQKMINTGTSGQVSINVLGL